MWVYVIKKIHRKTYCEWFVELMCWFFCVFFLCLPDAAPILISGIFLYNMFTSVTRRFYGCCVFKIKISDLTGGLMRLCMYSFTIYKLISKFDSLLIAFPPIFNWRTSGALVNISFVLARFFKFQTFDTDFKSATLSIIDYFQLLSVNNVNTVFINTIFFFFAAQLSILSTQLRHRLITPKKWRAYCTNVGTFLWKNWKSKSCNGRSPMSSF